MWEETLGFFVLLVPLVLALGYDRMVAVSIIFLGAGTGVLASTVNPFATGVASDAAGISISDGLGLRLVMLVVLVPLAIGLRALVRRAGSARIPTQVAPRRRCRPTWRSMRSARRRGRRGPAAHRAGRRSRWSSSSARSLIMIYGFIPWNDLWDTFFGSDFPLPTFGHFYFTEASMLFLVGAVVIGVDRQVRRGGARSTRSSPAPPTSSAPRW